METNDFAKLYCCHLLSSTPRFFLHVCVWLYQDQNKESDSAAGPTLGVGNRRLVDKKRSGNLQHNVALCTTIRVIRLPIFSINFPSSHRYPQKLEGGCVLQSPQPYL